MIYITAVKSFQFNTTPGIRFGAEESKNTAEEVTKKLGKKTQLVGDDLFVTNKEILQEGIDRSVANSILVKPKSIKSLSVILINIRIILIEHQLYYQLLQVLLVQLKIFQKI